MWLYVSLTFCSCWQVKSSKPLVLWLTSSYFYYGFRTGRILSFMSFQQCNSSKKMKPLKYNHAHWLGKIHFCVSGPDWHIPVPDTGRLDCSAHIARAQLAQKSKRHPPSRDKLRESFRKQVSIRSVKCDQLTLNLLVSNCETNTHVCPSLRLGRWSTESTGEPIAFCSHSDAEEQQEWPVQCLIFLSPQSSPSHRLRLHPSHLHQWHRHSLAMQILRIQKVQKEISRLQVQGLCLFLLS